MKIAIVAASGPAVGLGHVARCVALAQAVEMLHASKPIFLDLDAESRRWVAERGFRTQTGRRGSWDLLIADSYDLSRKDLESLRRKTLCLLVVQDAVAHPVACDWILNSTVYAHKLSYAGARIGGLLLGPKFQPLRREFWRQPPMHRRRRVANVLVTFGGGDVRNLLVEVLPMLLAALPTARFHVVIGPHSAAPPPCPRIVLHRSPRNLHALIASCDIAVSAGGQALYELAFSGLPAIAIEISNSQTPNLIGFTAAGIALSVGRPSSRGFPGRLQKAVRALSANEKLRATMADSGRRLVDGQGAIRVIRALSLRSDKEKRHARS